MTDGGDWLTVGATTVGNDGYDNPSDNGSTRARELDTTDWSYKTSEAVARQGRHPDRHGLRQVRQRRRAYFFAGAERVITNGATHVTFELIASPSRRGPMASPSRIASVGTCIIPIDFENGGVAAGRDRIYQVTGVTASANGQVVTVGPDISNTSDIRSAINFVDLPDQGGSGVNAVPAFGFAELSINLSAIGINTSAPDWPTASSAHGPVAIRSARTSRTS